ncbi:MAG: anti-sigma factor [Gammaproteobacteria bacterium]|jgi:anti-sigma factor ChrR (cupin superfamily)|nr:anti-sigma factor [Gammaproteobacteria bacterium]MBQ0775065.1 anti-sigma factor [Gammaproteobacteria bacterium]
MLKCRDIPSEAEKFLAGELSFGQRVSVRLHLFMCYNCRRYMRQLRVLLGALPGVPAAQPVSDDEVEQVMQRLDQCRHKHPDQ